MTERDINFSFDNYIIIVIIFNVYLNNRVSVETLHICRWYPRPLNVHHQSYRPCTLYPRRLNVQQQSYRPCASNNKTWTSINRRIVLSIEIQGSTHIIITISSKNDSLLIICICCTQFTVSFHNFRSCRVFWVFLSGRVHTGINVTSIFMFQFIQI